MRCFFSVFLCSYFSVVLTATKSSDDLAWPKDYTLANKQAITIYQPQVDSFQEGVIDTTSAFKINRENKEYYGTFNMIGKALVNKETSLVTISDIKISNVQLPVGGFHGGGIHR